MTDVGEEKALVDGNFVAVLVGGGVGGVLVRVSLSPDMRLTTLLLVVKSLLLHLLISLLILVLVTITSTWTFGNIVTGLTTPIANPLGMGFVVIPLPLLEDFPKGFDDEGHLLIVKLGGVNLEPLAWYSFLLLFFCCLECNGLWLGSGSGT
jgi:hypothetical protein